MRVLQAGPGQPWLASGSRAAADGPGRDPAGRVACSQVPPLPPDLKYWLLWAEGSAFGQGIGRRPVCC